jgi:hypothetical protein
MDWLITWLGLDRQISYSGTKVRKFFLPFQNQNGHHSQEYPSFSGDKDREKVIQITDHYMVCSLNLSTPHVRDIWPQTISQPVRIKCVQPCRRPSFKNILVQTLTSSMPKKFSNSEGKLFEYRTRDREEGIRITILASQGEIYSIYQNSYRYSPNYIYYITNRVLFHHSDVLEVLISTKNSFYSRYVI